MTKPKTEMSQIEKLPLNSLDLKEQQIQKLKEIFPEVFTEGSQVDWEKLRLTLGENIDVGKERFGMNWPGKADCFKTIQQPSIGTLVPLRNESIDFDITQNLFIEGDNLEVLKLLQKSYLGKIKMIYIDPPYNTGSDFIYPDNYAENLSTYLEYTGQTDSEGKKFATNTEADGRFHSKWMNMIYPRLFLAKNLLHEKGIIFISIDNNEVTNLRKICDEIFGEENFIEQISWKNKYGAGAKTKGFIEVHEYILCYSKQPLLNIEAPLSEDQIKAYKNKDEKFNLRGGYITQPLMTTSMGDRKNLQYPIIYNGDEIFPDKQWVWEKQRLLDAINNNEVVFNKDESTGKYSVRSKQYLKDSNGNIRSGKPISLFNGPFNQEGTAEVKSLFGYEAFTFPKPTSLLKYLLSFQVNEQKSEGIILDFFAGSGSLAQAVLELNSQDSFNWRFICVQLPEPLPETSIPYAKGLRTISDVCKQRIKLVISRLKNVRVENSAKQKESLFKIEDNSESDLGFKTFKLEPSNFKIWNSDITKDADVIQTALDLHVQHIAPAARQEAILYELLMKSGFELSTNVEKQTIAGKTIYSIADGELLICLEKELDHNLIEAIAEKSPSRVICLDEGFQNNDQLKTNAVQIMKSKNVLNFRTV